MTIHSVWHLTHVDMGFRTDHILTFNLPVPIDRLKGAEEINAFYRQLIERVQSVPGIVSASVSTGMPVQGTNFGMPFDIAGKAVADRSQRPGAGFSMVTPATSRPSAYASRKAARSANRISRAALASRS